jgi:hypothetical protein
MPHSHRARAVMSALFLLSGLAISQGLAAESAPAASSATAPLDPAALKAMVSGLGYETNDLKSDASKGKFEFTLSKDGLNVPIAAEITSSTNYIWLTSRLGTSRPDLNFEELLKSNASIQPCQFFISSKNALMIAIAIDNRAVTPVVLRRNIELLSNAVVSTKSLWLKE